MSLARAFYRAKEVGIRKTIGATRGQVIGQFLMEAVVISILALLFTVPCVGILIHYVPDMDDVIFSGYPTAIQALLNTQLSQA